MAFEEIRKAKEEYEEKLQTVRKEQFAEHFKDLFAQHPEVVKIQWRQYTPYFNDGDTCEFGMHGVTIHDKDGNQFEDWGDGPLNKIAGSTERELECLLDVIKKAFGDHAEVTVTPEGIDVDEYSHD